MEGKVPEEWREEYDLHLKSLTSVPSKASLESKRYLMKIGVLGSGQIRFKAFDDRQEVKDEIIENLIELWSMATHVFDRNSEDFLSISIHAELTPE